MKRNIGLHSFALGFAAKVLRIILSRELILVL
jgi:hypothetical protein